MSERKPTAGHALGRAVNEAATEALAEAWASIDGKLDYFRREKGMGMPPVADWKRLDWRGHYVGYMEEAEEMIRRLEARGFTVAARVSDENPKGEDPKGLSAIGIPARSSNGGDALSLSLSPKEQKGE